MRRPELPKAMSVSEARAAGFWGNFTEKARLNCDKNAVQNKIRLRSKNLSVFFGELPIIFIKNWLECGEFCYF